MNNDEFHCYVCQGVFKKNRTDEAAIAELKRDFPDYNTEQCELVCDGCLAKAMEAEHFPSMQ